MSDADSPLVAPFGQRRYRPHGERRLRGEDLVQTAAQQVLATGLLGDGSAFTPGIPVWTVEAADELVDAFVKQPDEGSGSFLVKLKDQLAGCSDTALQLAAELQYLTILPLSDMKPEK